MAVAGLLAGVLFFALYLFFNLTVAGQASENEWAWKYEVVDTIGYWLRQHDLPPLSFDRATIVVGTLLAVVVATSRRHWRAAVWVLAAVPGAVLVSVAFKSLFIRPLLIDSRDDAVSYPSGHAVIVLAVAAALLIVVPRGWTRWAAPVAGVWMAMATSAIVVIGDHRPSEIVGAALLTVAVFMLTGAVAHLRLAEPPASSGTRNCVPSSSSAVGDFLRAWMVAGTGALITLAGIVAAWGALPWVTAIDGAVGAVASLLILCTVFVVRSWIDHAPTAVSGDAARRSPSR